MRTVLNNYLWKDLKIGMALALWLSKRSKMKKIALLAGLALSLIISTSSQAQVRISLNFGLPIVQQSWYDYDDDYYYMPEVGAYYNVRRSMYVYPDNGSWAYGNCLPSRYNGFSYNDSRYVRLRERAPFNRNEYYSRQYALNNGYRGNDVHYNDRGRGGWDRNDRGQQNGGGRWNGGNNNNMNNGGWNGGSGRGHGRGR